jgi:hypothetical protein
VSKCNENNWNDYQRKRWDGHFNIITFLFGVRELLTSSGIGMVHAKITDFANKPAWGGKVHRDFIDGEAFKRLVQAANEAIRSSQGSQVRPSEARAKQHTRVGVR